MAESLEELLRLAEAAAARREAAWTRRATSMQREGKLARQLGEAVDSGDAALAERLGNELARVRGETTRAHKALQEVSTAASSAFKAYEDAVPFDVKNDVFASRVEILRKRGAIPPDDGQEGQKH